MKIISIEKNYRCERTEAISWLLLADSCILQKGRPFFVPDDMRPLLHASLAIRIDRLGKHIRKRFAGRYWSDWGVMIHMRDDRAMHDLMARGLSPVPAYAFDFCAVQGPFVPFADDLSPAFSVYRNGEKILDWNAAEMNRGIDEVIEEASFINTLKTGDLVMVATDPVGIPVEINDRISVDFGPASFRFNIK